VASGFQCESSFAADEAKPSAFEAPEGPGLLDTSTHAALASAAAFVGLLQALTNGISAKTTSAAPTPFLRVTISPGMT
jgi:hypothetical protein